MAGVEVWRSTMRWWRKSDHHALPSPCLAFWQKTKSIAVALAESTVAPLVVRRDNQREGTSLHLRNAHGLPRFRAARC